MATAAAPRYIVGMPLSPFEPDRQPPKLRRFRQIPVRTLLPNVITLLALCAGLTAIPFGGGQTERQVQLIRDFQPQIIMVTPSYMLAIADEFERQGMDPAASSLQIGIFGAEPWTPEMRAAIEARMGLSAVDIYGLSEVMGPGVASECAETKDGPTIWEDHFYPEIIDPNTGEVLPDGEFG